MKMKSLLLISYDYPPNDGGVSRLCSAVVDELASQDLPIEVLTVDGGAQQGPARPPVPTYTVPRRRVLREIATFWLLFHKGQGKTLLTSVWNPEATLALVFGKLVLGPRDVWIMAHGNEVMAYPKAWRYAFKRMLRRLVIRNARGIICNSRYTEGLVKDLEPCAKTHVINPGVHAPQFEIREHREVLRQRFAFPRDARVVLSVSRVVAHKGHDVVLRALASLAPEVRKRIHYAVAGTGSHLEQLKALAETLGVSPYVSWLGFVSDIELPHLYNAADLFVLCSREDIGTRGVEGFGMVFLEAQAAGLPVIGTRVGGICDAIIEGDGGWLIDQDDVPALASHLSSLVRENGSFVEQGRRGQRRARTCCSWLTYVDKLSRTLNGSTE